jgi:tryptophan 7-halogenase
MPVERIVIVGGGIAGWCAASALARKTESEIVVIDEAGVDHSLGAPSAVVATVPSASAFHAEIGHDENDMLSACGGTFSLGTAFSNLVPGPAAFVPFGDVGAALGPIGFHHLVARMRSEGQSVNLANFSVAALSAQAGRFARPMPGDRSVLSSLEYGFHLPSDYYAEWLRADAIAHGVKHISGTVAQIHRDASSLIAELTLDNGTTVTGDLFIDASGPDASLLSSDNRHAFECWDHWFRFDHSTTRRSPPSAEPPPYAHVDAYATGLQRFCPAQIGISEDAVYLAHTQSATSHAATPVRSGRSRAPWLGNCLALGGAAIVIDPTTPLPLALLHNAIRRLLVMLPNDRSCRIEAREYNRQFDEECNGARDIALLPYLRNSRFGEPFWDSCRAADAPSRLSYRIALYEQTGRITQYDGDILDATGWMMWFEALGIRPQRYDVMADGIPLNDITAHLDRIRSIMLNTLAILPSHAEYLAKHCPAPSAQVA